MMGLLDLLKGKLKKNDSELRQKTMDSVELINSYLTSAFDISWVLLDKKNNLDLIHFLYVIGVINGSLKYFNRNTSENFSEAYYCLFIYVYDMPTNTAQFQLNYFLDNYSNWRSIPEFMEVMLAGSNDMERFLMNVKNGIKEIPPRSQFDGLSHKYFKSEKFKKYDKLFQSV